MLALPVVLNEVFYDPAGFDGGFQFVELVNRSPLPVALTGWRIDAGDGAGPDRWRTWWTGTATDILLPAARFVVGEGRVEPAPDRIVPIELENGPDAVRLVAPDGSIDVLGYGTHTHAPYFEGRPAIDVPSGFSLARAADGVDTDDNAADWIPLSPPTPGAPNRPERDLAVVRLIALAERVEPGDVVALDAVVANRGVLSLPANEAEARLWVAPLSEATLPGVGVGEDPFTPLAAESLVVRAALAELEPGDSVTVHLSFTPPTAGTWRLVAAATAPEDGAPANDRLPAIVQVGPGALMLSEVAAAPDDGPEWIEVVNRTGADVALDGWTVEDATGRRGRVTVGAPGGAFAVAPESLVVLTSDPAALVARHPGLDARQVAACTPWPSLNNDPPSGAPAGSAADRLVLRPPDGRASDALDLPPANVGRTRERRSLARATREPANWSDSAVPGGTPARVNSVAGGPPVPGIALTVSPSAHVRGEPVLLRWSTGFESARVTLALYDLRGRRLRLLVDEDDAPGTAGVAWDGADDAGRPAPPGLYLVGLRARAAGAVAHVTARAWLSVE